MNTSSVGRIGIHSRLPCRPFFTSRAATSAKPLTLLQKSLGTFAQNSWHFCLKLLALLPKTLGTFLYHRRKRGGMTKRDEKKLQRCSVERHWGEGAEVAGCHLYRHADMSAYVWRNRTNVSLWRTRQASFCDESVQTLVATRQNVSKSVSRRESS